MQFFISAIGVIAATLLCGIPSYFFPWVHRAGPFKMLTPNVDGVPKTKDETLEVKSSSAAMGGAIGFTIAFAVVLWLGK